MRPGGLVYHSVSLMSNPKPLLQKLAEKGKPLAEVVVIPVNELDREMLAMELDELAPDISCELVPGYFQPEDGPVRYEIRFEATKEALSREFGWILLRTKIYDSESDGFSHPDAYGWLEENEPEFYPLALRGKIKKMGLTQPGRSDNGTADNISYEIEPG